MIRYVIYNTETGEIIRCCTTLTQQSFENKHYNNQNESILKITNQKRGFMPSNYWHRIIGGKIVNKTPQKIDEDNPPKLKVSYGQRQINITNEQWQNILDRLEQLEK